MDDLTTVGPTNSTVSNSSDAYIGNAVYALPLDQLRLLLEKVLSLFIIIFGTFGNVMIVVIMHKMRGSDVALNIFFITLAISDTSLLFSGLLRKIIYYYLRIDIFILSTFSCKVSMWILYVTGMLSPWLLVAMTAQRAASVVWPHRVKVICRPNRSKALMFSIIMFVFLLNAHFFYGVDVRGPYYNGTVFYCEPWDQEYVVFYVNVWSLVDLLISSLIPFVLLIISNFILIWKLTVSARQARMKLATRNTARASDRAKKTSSVTVTLVILSFAFLLLTLPYVAILVYVIYFLPPYSSRSTSLTSLINFLYFVGNMTWYSSSAVNFYLYCLTGTKFRRAFLEICRLKTKPRKSERSSSTNMWEFSSSSRIRITKTMESNDDDF